MATVSFRIFSMTLLMIVTVLFVLTTNFALDAEYDTVPATLPLLRALRLRRGQSVETTGVRAISYSDGEGTNEIPAAAAATVITPGQATAVDPEAMSAERTSYKFDGPLPERAELPLRSGLTVDSAIEVHGKLYGAIIIEIISLSQDVLLHVNIRSYQSQIVVNEQSTGLWGAERTVAMPFTQDVVSIFTIEVTDKSYKMLVDGRPLMTYDQKNDPHAAMTLAVRVEDEHRDPMPVIHKIHVYDVPTKRIAIRDLLKDIVDRSTRQSPLSLDRHVRLFVGVMSRPTNTINRFAVRNGWMQEPEVQNGNVAVRFFVGQETDPHVVETIHKEIDVYDDMIISPYKEGYFSIANKTRHIFETATTRIQADYVMKCDDDTYVRIDRILKYLQSLPQDGLVLGTVSMYAVPIRNKRSKWYMPESEWASATFPPFPHGPGYVLSSNLVREITHSFQKNEIRALRLEDVSVGVWIDYVRKKLGLVVTYKHDARFNFANCRTGDMIGHYVSPSRMVCMWEMVQADSPNWCCNPV